MHSKNFLLLLAALTTALPQREVAQLHPKKLYLFEDIEHHQWCAFGEKSIWQDAVNKISALRVGTVDYIDDHIAAIDMTEESESGDWVVYDHYSFDEDGILSKLNRTINVLPGDQSVKSVFVIHNNKAKKRSTVALKLSTGNPVSRSKEWLPHIPIITNAQAFPFSPLIDAKQFKIQISSQSRMCMPVSHP
jgi:hypothetical protein